MAYEYDAGGQHFYDNFQSQALFVPYFSVVSLNNEYSNDSTMRVQYRSSYTNFDPNDYQYSKAAYSSSANYIYNTSAFLNSSEINNSLNYATTSRKNSVGGYSTLNSILTSQSIISDSYSTTKEIIGRFYFMYSSVSYTDGVNRYMVPGYIDTIGAPNDKGYRNVVMYWLLTSAQRKAMQRQYYIKDSYGSRMYIQIDNTRRQLYTDNGSIAVKNDNAVSKFGKIWVKSENTWRSVYSSPGGTQYYQ